MRLVRLRRVRAVRRIVRPVRRIRISDSILVDGLRLRLSEMVQLTRRLLFVCLETNNFFKMISKAPANDFRSLETLYLLSRLRRGGLPLQFNVGIEKKNRFQKKRKNKQELKKNAVPSSFSTCFFRDMRPCWSCGCDRLAAGLGEGQLHRNGERLFRGISRFFSSNRSNGATRSNQSFLLTSPFDRIRTNEKKIDE